jgi:chromosome segregation ATPase
VPNNFNQRDVYGKFLKLFKIKDVKSHHLAIEAAAGGRMFNVVVKNERVSKELI